MQDRQEQSTSTNGPGFGGPITREELHTRHIEMKGYLRSDGLYELEGRVTDSKPHEFAPISGGGRVVPANEPIHDMGLRLAYDDAMVVRAVETFTLAHPYTACPEGGRALQAIVGLSMTSGWSKEVRSRLGGARSCTHLMELLIPLATVAVQSLSARRAGQQERTDDTGRPLKIDSCYAYGAEGELVLRRWPEFHRPPKQGT